MWISDNFSDKDVGEPILDVILEAGDMLYFPRGVIHQVLTERLGTRVISWFNE